MARSLTTTDHETIRNWAEQRGGKPSEVASTAKDGDVGIIRIDFPGDSGEGKLQEISWDDWFKKFDASSLAFVYEEETADGQRSSFNKLVGRETADARAEGVKTNRRALRSGTAKRARAGSPRGSRQAARPEAARTARSGRSTRGGSTAARGSAQGKKSSAGRKRASTGRSASSGRSTGAGRTPSRSGAKKGARGAARKG